MFGNYDFKMYLHCTKFIFLTGTGANPMNVSWTQVRSEYRDVARDHDVNSSSLYLHSVSSSIMLPFTFVCCCFSYH